MPDAEPEVIYEACSLCQQPVKVTERNLSSRSGKVLLPIYCSPPCVAPDAVARSITRWADLFGTHEYAEIALSRIPNSSPASRAEPNF